MLLAVAHSPVAAWATEEGQEDLDRAVEAKLSAESVREYGAVIDLCQSALNKGLDEANTSFAKQLLASTLTQRAELIGERILEAREPDPRLPQLRQIALIDLERSLKVDPKQPSAHLLVASLQSLPGGDRKRALTAVDAAIELLADEPAARADALVTRAGLRDVPEKRLADLNEAIELAPKEPKPLRARGATYLAQRKGEEALADFDAALELEPDDVPTLEVRGLALGMLERWDEARESYTRAAKLSPDSPEALIQRGRINALSGDTSAAIADVTEALKVAPNDLGALFFRARVLAQTEKTEEALADISRVLELKPELTIALRFRAELLALTGKLDAAIVDLERVREAEPDDPMPSIQLGMLYGGKRRLAKAIEAYSAAIALESKSWVAYRGRADALLSMGKQREAIADYEEALEMQPDNSSVLNNLAWILATSPDDDLRDGKRSIELATKACEVTEFKQAHILSTLAAGYAESGDFKTAIEWSRRAVDLSAEEIKANLNKELASYQDRKPWRELQNDPEEPADKKPDVDRSGDKKADDKESGGGDSSAAAGPKGKSAPNGGTKKPQ